MLIYFNNLAEYNIEIEIKMYYYWFVDSIIIIITTVNDFKQSEEVSPAVFDIVF